MSIIDKRSNQKRMIIFFLVILMVILCITLCILHILKTIKSSMGSSINKVSQEDIENNPEAYTVEEILNSFGCKNIEHKTNNMNGERSNTITLVFKYNLYEKNESKEDYFNKIVLNLKKVLVNPFELIDDEHLIDIYVDKENDIYTINGITDFFNNEAYKKVVSHSELPSTKGIASAQELYLMTAGNWERMSVKFDKEIKEIDKEYIYYDDFKISYNDNKINYIVFSKDYSEMVFENIKVGESFEKIKDKLGKPTFKYKDKMIGYKTTDLYVFFYEDEIAIYPLSRVYSIENQTLENDIYKFYNGKYEDDLPLFVKNIIDNYLDFKSEITEDGVKVSSYLRGIELFFPNEETIKIKIYDNYCLEDKLKVLAESGKVELDFEEDSIYLNEIERYFK